jgi:hypothetical protein
LVHFIIFKEIGSLNLFINQKDCNEDEFWSEIIEKTCIKQELENLKITTSETNVLEFLKKQIRETRFQEYENTIQFAFELSKKENIVLGILSNHADV